MAAPAAASRRARRVPPRAPRVPRRHHRHTATATAKSVARLCRSIERRFGLSRGMGVPQKQMRRRTYKHART